MAIQSKSTLKGYFVAAAQPTSGNFTDLVDSLLEETTVSTAMRTFTSAASVLAAYDILTLSQTLAPGGRLTLTTATPVTTADVTAATTLYYAFYKHNFAPLYDGTRWTAKIFTELSLALDSNSGHTGYHQQDKNFDVFVYSDSGTLRLCTGPAWSSDTARAGAIARNAGRWTNSASMVLRYDASTTTVTAAESTALYVGTIRCTANGQVEDSLAKRFVWNVYNRVARPTRAATETADSWTYTTATIRQANANAANQLDMVRGLDEDRVSVLVNAAALNSAGASPLIVGIGLDSTTAFATGFKNTFSGAAVVIMPLVASWCGLPGLGRHYIAWLEYSVASGTTTWYGDAGAATLIQSGISGDVFA